MNFGLSMSAPLPWLTILLGRLFGKTGGSPVAPTNAPRSFLKLPRSLKVTRQGKWYIGVLLLIGVAAINTGNNLLYLVDGMLLSLIIISGLMSESTLRKVSIERSLPARAKAGDETLVRLIAFNHKKFLPSVSFRLKEAHAAGVTAPGAYLLKLGAKESAARTTRYVFGKRGVARLGGVTIETGFPFGLFIKGKHVDLPAELIVHPRTRRLSGKEFVIEGAAIGDKPSSRKGAGFELFGLREHLIGEDARGVDWKASARAMQLLHKEFEAEAERNVMVVFENRSRADANDDRFEKAVEEAASIVAHLIGRGARVGLRTLTSEIPCGRGNTDSIMTALALVEPVEEGEPVVRVVAL